MKLMSGNSNLPLVKAIANYLEIPVTEASERHHGPHRRVRVLAAVLADPGGIGLHVTGVRAVPVEGGREHLGKTVRISVTSVLQTSAGRMIFGRVTEAG